MRFKDFALVVGFATLAALILAMLILSCGSPDCACDYPEDGGSSDWFDAYYFECVDMCDAAEEWGEACGHPPAMEGCVEWLWWRGIDQEACEKAAKCYDVLKAAEDCEPTTAMDPEHDGVVDPGWYPTVWTTCRIEVP